MICPDCASRRDKDQKLIDQFCRRSSSRKSGVKTVLAYRGELAKLCDFLFAAGVTLLEARQSDLVRFLEAGDSGDRGKAKQLSVFRVFYRWLVETNRLDSSPVYFLRIKKTWSNIPRFRSEEEVKQSLENAWKRAHAPKASPLAIRDWAIKELLYASGVRREECADIDLRDLNLKEWTMWVKGKGGKERVPQIDPRGVDAVQFYLEHARHKLSAGSGTEAPSDALFLGRHGGRLSLARINRIVHEITPHQYRHRWARDKAKAGVDLELISINLGHGEKQVTMIYVAPVLFEELQEAHRKYHPSEEGPR